MRSPVHGGFLRSAGVVALVAGLGLLDACTLQHARRLQRRYGDEATRAREVATLAAGAVDYWSEVRPIFESRCVVCHGCYDAPCQLKLGSVAGIERGASKERVYDALRLRQADTTRLFEDAATSAAWRDKGFHPVVNERAQSEAGNRQAGLMFRLLDLKRRHPVAADGLLPADVDLTLRREEKCPTVEELPRHAREHPQWGMPYGMTGLSAEEHAIVTRWLEEGARYTPPPPLPEGEAAVIARWEALLNGDSLRARLASRYIYEHLFLAHLYFETGDDGAPSRFFELVRSRTPPGQAIARVATRRPYDDPGTGRPYYRIQPVSEAVVAKLHLPYRLDDARMRRWRELFFDAEYEVRALPSYAPEVASNPFVAFQAIPVPARYRFMLDEAEFTIMGFIKGAVCRGPIALNVIDDHFWIFFVDPDVDSRLQEADFLARQGDALAMPAEAGSNALPISTWVRDAVRQRRYMEAKRAAVRADFAGPRKLTLDALWDGDRANPNAALSVFRHFDSASVVRGMVGEGPKTAWILGYPLLERIHYLLVAGFDVYGNVGHQLATRTYMDFLRMEAEFTFLAFLPPAARVRERDFWYRGAGERIHREIVGEVTDLGVESGVEFVSDAPKLELYEMLADRYRAVDERRFALDGEGVPEDILVPLKGLAERGGAAISRAPEVAFVLVPDGPAGAQVFTVIHNLGHLNISSPLDADERRAPLEDTLTVARGLIGTYPNALFVAPRAELVAFAEAYATAADEAAYAALQERYGVRRTSPRLWAISDRIHAIFREIAPIEAGILDLSRLENR